MICLCMRCVVIHVICLIMLIAAFFIHPLLVLFPIIMEVLLFALNEMERGIPQTKDGWPPM